MCRDAEGLDKITRYSMGCPALPLCGLAIGEAERGLPDINIRIRALIDRLGFGPEEHFHVRMTGMVGMKVQVSTPAETCLRVCFRADLVLMAFDSRCWY